MEPTSEEIYFVGTLFSWRSLLAAAEPSDLESHHRLEHGPSRSSVCHAVQWAFRLGPSAASCTALFFSSRGRLLLQCNSRCLVAPGIQVSFCIGFKYLYPTNLISFLPCTGPFKKAPHNLNSCWSIEVTQWCERTQHLPVWWWLEAYMPVSLLILSGLHVHPAEHISGPSVRNV